MSTHSTKPTLTLITQTSSTGGRPKQPLEKRKALSDRPHKNRKGPEDLEMSSAISPEELPTEPPKPLSKYERECWDMIVGTQTGRKSKWIYRSDCSHLIATCMLWARLMEIRNEINQLKEDGVPILDPDTGKANPLYALEGNTAAKVQSSLRDLGLVPTRRQVTLAPDDNDEDDGLLR